MPSIPAVGMSLRLHTMLYNSVTRKITSLLYPNTPTNCISLNAKILLEFHSCLLSSQEWNTPCQHISLVLQYQVPQLKCNDEHTWYQCSNCPLKSKKHTQHKQDEHVLLHTLGILSSHFAIRALDRSRHYHKHTTIKGIPVRLLESFIKIHSLLHGIHF